MTLASSKQYILPSNDEDLLPLKIERKIKVQIFKGSKMLKEAPKRKF